MRKFLLSVPAILLVARTAFGAGCDTIVTVSSLGGFTAATAGATGILKPATALHALLANCSDSSRTITLVYTDASHGDTLRLDNEIVIDNRSGKTTKFVGRGTGNGPVTFMENDGKDPMLVDAKPNNRVDFTNFGFARLTTVDTVNAVTKSSVRIESKSSQLHDCFFYMADNNNLGSPRALLSLTGDSILVERCVFRAPPNGTGRAVAIYTDSSSNKSSGARKLDIRANLFYSTGIYMRYGQAHIYANTFAGSRNVYNAIIVGAGITDMKTVNIQHNLFALKVDSLPPIVLSGNPASADSILKNAYSTNAKPGMDIAVNGTGGKVTLNNTSGFKNEVLPRGFSDYAPTKTEFKQYPLTELRTDSLLSTKASDFGHIPSLYSKDVVAWSPMNPIATDLPTTKFYSSGTPFTPLSGGSWTTGSAGSILVGALGVTEGSPLPSPVLGPAGTGFNVHKSASDATKLIIGNLDFDSSYFRLKTVPATVMLFVSDSLSKLASNDSTVLKASVGSTGVISRTFLNLDTNIVVPKEVRTGGDVYVKVLHFNAAGQGPVLSTDIVTSRVTGVPAYPATNLTAPSVDSTGAASGTFKVTVTNVGPEAIDSIMVVAATQGGSTVDSKTVPAPAVGTSISPSLTFNLPKGTFVLNATPVAKLGSVRKLGTPTSSVTVHSGVIAGDTVYFSNKTPCNNAAANGLPSNPYCGTDGMDSALADIKKKQGGVILVQVTGTPYANFAVGGTDNFPLIIASDKLPTEEFKDRAVLQGASAKPAASITRPNVTLRGFFIEMPVGASGTALDVKGAGAVVDANIFRPAALDGASGPAVNIDVGAQETQLINNVFWGYTTSISVSNSTSANVRIMHNTFVNEAAFANSAGTTGITIAAGAFNGLIANNFFSGQTLPIDQTFTGKGAVLDHNVFTTSNPNLFGLNNSGALDSVPRLGQLNLTSLSGNDYKLGQLGFQTVMESYLECFTFKPCVSLYAGASTARGTTANDVFDKKRSDPKEVGAYEALHINLVPRGVLSVKVDASTSSSLSFTVTAKTFDPAEPESVFVWWSPSNDDNSFKNVTASTQKHFSVADLVSAGKLTGIATGLEPSRTYYVYAAFHDNDAPDNPVGYGYRTNARTDDAHLPGDTTLTKGQFTTVVPKNGSFISSTSPFQGQYQTVVTFSQPVDSGTISNPVFSNAPASYKGVSLYASMPQFTLGMGVGGMGAPKSKLKATAAIEMTGDPKVEGQDLFIIPPAGALPIFVPNWSVSHSGGKTTISVEVTSKDIQQYAFGKVNTEAGRIAPASPDAAPIYDFTSPQDSQQVAITVTGSGFNTANPLVLVTLIPAGGVALTDDKGPLSGKYYAKTYVYAAGFGAFDPDLRRDLFYSYYQKARLAEAQASAPSGTRKPLTLDSVTLGDFDNSTLMGNPPWTSVSNTGELGPGDISISLTRAFKTLDKSYKASRSQEAVITVFDGAKISRSRAFIRTKFTDNSMYGTEKQEMPINQWNLFAYPWDEVDTGSLARVVGESKWADDRMRLMSYKGTGTGSAAFTTYNGGNPNGFRFDSGAAAWSGFKDHPYSSVSAEGTSLDYQAFTINLAANQWNDVGLPFNFPIRWNDVLDSSTGATTLSVWRYRTATKAWERVDRGAIILPWEGLTINPGAAAAALRIPVLDTLRSSNGVAKAAASTIWSRRIQAFDASGMMLLDIGKAARETVYPEAPSVPGQDFRVGLRRLKADKEEKLSQYVQSSEDGVQGHWALSTTAFQGAKGVSLRLESADKGMPVWLVDALHKTSVALRSDSDAYVTAEELRANDYHLVAGDEAYLQGVMDGLSPVNALKLSNYPNPFAGATYIRYVLPLGFGDAEFRMKIRDSRGRMVWEKDVRGGTSLNYLWDGKDLRGAPAPAGFYTLSLEAAAPGKATYRATRRLLKM